MLNRRAYSSAAFLSMRLRRVLFPYMVLFASSETQGSDALPLESALPITVSFLDYCLTPPRQDLAFTCVAEDFSKPDPARFKKLVFEGVTNQDLPLIQARSNALSFLLKGQRCTRIREFSSASVHTTYQEDLFGENPLSALGHYKTAWDTDYTLYQVY